MPTYDYQCTECGSVFEEFQSIKAKPLRKTLCETCGERRPVRRLIGTGGAVIFKGSGFYQTDYRDDSYRRAAKADGDTKSKPDAKRVTPETDKPPRAPAASEAASSPARSVAVESSQSSDGPASRKPASKGKGGDDASS